MRCFGICGSISSVAVIAALTACAVGTAFVRPPEDLVHLGETTRAQVVGRFGKPDEDEHRRINGQSLRVISYTYSSGAEAPKVPNTLCVRSIEFTLAGDIVVGEGFASACASDHTDFDDHRAREIVVEKTRCDEVIAMLGRPAARAVYPIAREKGDLFLAYRFAYPKRPLLQLNIYQKVLAIGCSADGLVREVEFMERAANREGTLAPTRLRAKGGAMKPPGASRLIVSVVVAAALSAGAAGTGFVRPPADAVRLGETTRAQIVERFGKARLERQFRLNGVTLWSAEYFVASDAEAPTRRFFRQTANVSP